MTDDLDALEQAARATKPQCEAVRDLLTTQHRCARRAVYGGRWCFQHAHSVGGYVLTTPGMANAYRRAVDCEERLIAAVREADALREAISDHVPSGGEGMDGYGYEECSCGWMSISPVSWSDHVLRAALSSTEPSHD